MVGRINVNILPKILFIAPLRLNRAPSQRFRFEQFLDYFKENGFEYSFSCLITPEIDSVFYSKGKLFKKFLLLLKFASLRFKDVNIASAYDIVFIKI